MARKRSAPRKRRPAGAPTRAQAAQTAPADPGDGRLTDQVLRKKLRRGSKPVISLFSVYGTAKEAAEERMDEIRRAMR
jgi:hypothetical protein